jgi:hypothetical protein
MDLRITPYKKADEKTFVTSSVMAEKDHEQFHSSYFSPKYKLNYVFGFISFV